jgi:hypothetical protein
VVTATDECFAVDHFPSEPIGDSPSKAILYFTVPSEFAGWQIAVLVDGASGQVEGLGIVADDGLGIVEVPLNAYGAHQVQEVLVTQGAELVAVELVPAAFLVDASEPTCDPAGLERAPVTVATTAAPTTTVPVTTTAAPTTTTMTPTTTAAAPTTTAGVATTSSGGLPWGWIGLGVGLPSLLIGLWLLAGPGRDCQPLRVEWERRQARYDTIREAFEHARAYLEERRAARAEIKGEIADIERVGAMGSTVEGGNRFKLIPEGRVTEEGFDQILGTARDRLESAREAERSAEESLENWRRQLEEAAAQAEAARKAYDDCIGAAVAAAAPAATTSGGPAVAATPAEPGCPEGTRQARSLSAPRTFRVYVDFSVIVEVEEGSERNVQAGEDLAVNLGQLGLTLGTVGSLFGARGAGGNLAGGIMGLGAGSYVKGAAGIARGSLESVLAVRGNLGTDSFPIPVPTSPEEVLVGVLQVTAQLGAVVAGKVTEWMKMNQIYRVRSTLFYQEVTAQPLQIWECRGGRWACAENVVLYEVSDLKRQQGRAEIFRLESDVARHRFEAHVNGLTARAEKSIEDSARSLIDFEQANSPGPCR